jgi:hypothetical protein
MQFSLIISRLVHCRALRAEPMAVQALPGMGIRTLRAAELTHKDQPLTDHLPKDRLPKGYRVVAIVAVRHRALRPRGIAPADLHHRLVRPGHLQHLVIQVREHRGRTSLKVPVRRGCGGASIPWGKPIACPKLLIGSALYYFTFSCAAPKQA